jgi:hypothetical protein
MCRGIFGFDTTGPSQSILQAVFESIYRAKFSTTSTEMVYSALAGLALRFHRFPQAGQRKR